MKRSAVYHSKNKHRVISLNGDLWIAQRHTGDTGTNVIDPWQNIGRPSTYQIACERMQRAAELSK